MKKRARVSTIMTKNLITVNYNDDLTTAEALFKEHHIRHIPVVSGDTIIGMLSHTDLMRVSYADNLEEVELEVGTVVNSLFTIEQVMAKKVVCVSSEATIKEVAEILAEREFHALPVVENEKLVGIVTTTDLINYLLQQFH
ncbi:CBS domain-containing protein [Tenacibaculum sp. IB213877]|uniref:CBS domain-containing protein n=1 Tax=Tenacibaculum sp. IB213877 TaxID=3097351 RepID=UPI002A5B089C|nr:CBS domain-containing protein [Tenacibaculum sp. IB213877]MDY0781401.1 CBS domain-containing protein [Tenacibaculum sp. IB213877]